MAEIKNGQELNNIWLKSWIKSKNYKPGAFGFMIDGMTGNVEFGKGYFRGDITGASGTFSGTITAIKGLIGKWTISSDALYFDGATDALSSGMAPVDYPFYAGKKYVDRATAPFRVTPDGILVATGATITDGTITGGTIQTATINKRVEMTDNKINIYSDTGLSAILEGGDISGLHITGIYFGLNPTADTLGYIGWSNGLIIATAEDDDIWLMPSYGRVVNTSPLCLWGVDSAPTANEGTIYYNSTTHKLYVHNGTAWKEVAFV